MIPTSPIATLSLAGLAGMIDFTNLDINATEDDIRNLCALAIEHGFASVCIRPPWVKLAAELLRGTGVKVCTVISFHEGRDLFTQKVKEARRAIDDGAEEIDWVLNFRYLISGDYDLVTAEVANITALARQYPRVIFKLILECCALEDPHKISVCGLLRRSGAVRFAKTSTGYGTPLVEGGFNGATVEDVALLRAHVGPNMEVKASGGIRTLEDVLALLRAGAGRFGIGWKSTLKIMDEARAAGYT